MSQYRPFEVLLNAEIYAASTDSQFLSLHIISLETRLAV